MRIILAAAMAVVVVIYMATLLKHPRLATSWNDLTPDGMQPNDWASFFTIPPAH